MKSSLGAPEAGITLFLSCQSRRHDVDSQITGNNTGGVVYKILA
jgi:hypothetical protein